MRLKKQMVIKEYDLRIVTFLLTVAFGFSAGGIDMPYGYRSSGTDVYASGEPVRDGECYSFVWVRNGSDFAGYNRDGSLVDTANNMQIYVRSLAVGGRCPPVSFMIDSTFASTHTDGQYRVFVLDTRCANGMPAGLDESSALRRVNGWGEAKLRRTMTRRLSASPAGDGGICSRTAKIPAGCRKPVITRFSVNADGDVFVEVSNTERYLTYRIVSGTSLVCVGDSAGREKRDGNGTDEPIRLTARQNEIGDSPSAFIQVETTTDL